MGGGGLAVPSAGLLGVSPVSLLSRIFTFAGALQILGLPASLIDHLPKAQSSNLPLQCIGLLCAAALKVKQRRPKVKLGCIVLNVFRSCYLNWWFCKFWIYFSKLYISTSLNTYEHIDSNIQLQSQLRNKSMLYKTNCSSNTHTLHIQILILI